MSEEEAGRPQETRSIADELSKLVAQLTQAAKAAWESEERQKLQAEIVEGVQTAAAQLSAAAQKAAESDTAAKLRTKADEVAAEIRESDVVGEVRKGIIAGLDVLNRELGRLLEKLEEKPAPPAEAEPAEAPAPEPAEGEPEQTS